MVIFLFWMGATISLIAAGMGVFGQRPLMSVLGLVALMLANSILFFMLSAPLLAIELLLGTLGVGLGFWVILVRPGRIQLAAPGLVRFGLNRLISILVACGFCVLLVVALDQSPEVSSNSLPTRLLMPGWVYALAAIFLLGSVAAIATLLVRFVRQSDEGDNR